MILVSSTSSIIATATKSCGPEAINHTCHQTEIVEDFFYKAKSLCCVAPTSLDFCCASFSQIPCANSLQFYPMLILLSSHRYERGPFSFRQEAWKGRSKDVQVSCTRHQAAAQLRAMKRFQKALCDTRLDPSPMLSKERLGMKPVSSHPTGNELVPSLHTTQPRDSGAIQT